jgi:hypothetical protein
MSRATSVWFDDETLRVIRQMEHDTGVKRSELLRRLVRAYANGLVVPGLAPVIGTFAGTVLVATPPPAATPDDETIKP